MIRRAPVRLRTTGLTDPAGHVLIRFGTTEPHALIKTALANADRYDELLRLLGHRSGRAALTLSCFAATTTASPHVLATGTEYTTYRRIRAAALRELAFAVWPTTTDPPCQAPGPRRDVHFDIVLAIVQHEQIQARTGSVEQRRELRNHFIPLLDPLLRRLEGPFPLDRRA